MGGLWVVGEMTSDEQGANVEEMSSEHIEYGMKQAIKQ